MKKRKKRGKMKNKLEKKKKLWKKFVKSKNPTSSPKKKWNKIQKIKKWMKNKNQTIKKKQKHDGRKKSPSLKKKHFLEKKSPTGTLRDGSKKWYFSKEMSQKNREAIEAPKSHILSTREKEKEKKNLTPGPYRSQLRPSSVLLLLHVLSVFQAILSRAQQFHFFLHPVQPTIHLFTKMPLPSQFSVHCCLQGTKWQWSARRNCVIFWAFSCLCAFINANTAPSSFHLGFNF